MIDHLVDWWRRRRWTMARYSEVRYFSNHSDLPELPSRRTVAVVGTPEHRKWAVFACPCGHGHAIAANLSAARRPHWSLTEEPQGPSLHPSIDSVTDERRCHFWLRAGRVRWVREDVRSQEILRTHPTGQQGGGTGHGA